MGFDSVGFGVIFKYFGIKNHLFGTKGVDYAI